MCKVVNQLRKKIIPVAPNNNNVDTASLLKMLDEMGRPFTAKLDRIEEKMSNHATKADIEKLRQELVSGYVSKDVYNTQHGQLVGRDLQLDEAIRSERQERDKDMADIKELIRDTNSQLEASRRQVESRFVTVESNVERRLKESAEAQLSTKDRAWIRTGQMLAWIALAVAAVSPFIAAALSHLEFH